jgi:hypothetical protein
LTCPHLHYNRPGVTGVTALYRPDTLACTDLDCLNVFALDGPSDFQCDRCLEVVSEIAAIVFEAQLDELRLLVLFGACAACEAKELAA